MAKNQIYQCICVSIYNANRERNDQVLKTCIAVAIAIAVCSMTVSSYVMVNHHGWHLNAINGPLMWLI